MSLLAGLIASLAFSVLSTFYGAWQTNRFISRIERTIPDDSSVGASAPNNPDLRRSYIEQLVEIAYALPSLLVTVLSVFSALDVNDDLSAYVLVGAIVLLTLIFWLGDPANSNRVRRLRIGRVSLIGVGLIAINIIVVALVVLNP